MRVLFDGFWWTAGPTANRVVQRELVRGWRQEFEQDEIVVAVRRSHLAQASGDLPPRTEVVTTRVWPHGLSNLTELGRLGRRTGADVIVAHNYTPRSRRAATFVHDAMFLDHPEWFSVRERVYFSAMLPSARRALVTATSTRTEAARIGRLEPRLPPVTAIGLAVSTELATAEPVRPADVPAVEAFALCVGRLNIRKNLAAAIAAAGASRSATPRTPLLVVGGAEYSGVGAPVPAELREHIASGAVRFLGRVSDAELAWLYQHAAVTVCLSLVPSRIDRPHLAEPLDGGQHQKDRAEGRKPGVDGAEDRRRPPGDEGGAQRAVIHRQHQERPQTRAPATLRGLGDSTGTLEQVVEDHREERHRGDDRKPDRDEQPGRGHLDEAVRPDQDRQVDARRLDPVDEVVEPLP